jgi:hypothetical protein
MRREAHFVESLRFKGAWADDAIYGMLRREHVGSQRASFLAEEQRALPK